MYDETLQFDSQIFHDAEELTIKTFTIDRGLRSGGAEGRLKVTVRADEDDVVLDTLTTLTMTLLDSDDDGDTDAYTAIIPSISRVRPTTAADTTFKQNEAIMDVPIPKGVKKWIKPSLIIGGTIGATEGTVEIILEYLAN